MRARLGQAGVVFTSIGKKVITATTAALDGQSKPNHITMIGAMPTIGMALTRLPSGSSPRLRKVGPVDRQRRQEARRRSRSHSRAARSGCTVCRKSAPSMSALAAQRGGDGGGRRQR